MTDTELIEALNDRIAAVHTWIAETKAKMPTNPTTEEEKREARSLGTRLYNLREKLPALLFAAGRTEEVTPEHRCSKARKAITMSHSLGKDDLACLPFGHVLIDKGKDGDLFLAFIRSPAGNGWIRLELQTRYQDSRATCYPTEKGARDMKPSLCTWDIKDDDDSEFERFRIETADPPDQEKRTAAATWEARSGLSTALHPYKLDGWFRWTREAKALAETFPYWEGGTP